MVGGILRELIIMERVGMFEGVSEEEDEVEECGEAEGYISVIPPMMISR